LQTKTKTERVKPNQTKSNQDMIKFDHVVVIIMPERASICNNINDMKTSPPIDFLFDRAKLEQTTVGRPS
jgi:hypothetical protein